MKEKTVMVFGKGVSGDAAKRLLEKEGAKVIYVDDGDFCAADKQNVELVVISPGVNPDNKIYAFCKGRGIKIISEIDLGYSYIKDKTIVGITGTNGKTTTTKLIYNMLKSDGQSAELCGNVGVPICKCVLNSVKDVYAVELSSFQLSQSNDFKPNISIITNISPDHISYHKTMESYIEAKLSITKNQTKNDYLILSLDDIPFNYLRGFSPKCKVIYTSISSPVDGAYVYKDNIYYMGEKLFETDRIKLNGIFNIKNVLSSVAAAKILNVSNDAIIKTVTTFAADNHRLKLVENIDGVYYYNDSKGTNIAASLAAANEMCGDTVILLGGRDKGIEYDSLFSAFKSNVIAAVIYGETSKKMLDAASRVGFSNVFKANDLTEAVHIASAIKPKNVLLSPATSSFDMFLNYEERGDFFESVVRSLIK